MGATEGSIPRLLLAVGLAVAVLVGPTPAGLTPAGQAALATATFAGVSWVTGALPMAITSLLVPVALVATGAQPSLAPALTGFADPLIALFLGTFVLADALARQGLDRRLAVGLVSAVGTSPRRLILALMVATAGLSMVISNTATAAVMVPLALGLVRDVGGGEKDAGTGNRNLHVATLLGVAYAASVGGVGTIIGSPPNAIVVDALERAGVAVSFVDWLAVGVPIVVVTLPLAWALLVYPLFPPATTATDRAEAADRLATLRRDLPPITPTGRRVAVVFLGIVTLWILGGLGSLAEPLLPPGLFEVLYGGEAGAGLLYFPLVGLLAVPALYLVGGTTVAAIGGIDWPTLVLFGGGLSLADGLVRTNATEWLANAVLTPLSLPLVVMVLVVVGATILLSELASNTATAAILAPVLLEVGRTSATAPPADTGILLALAAGIAASFGFALPVATPPNAIVYGTGEIERTEMLRAGVVLDVALGLVTALLVIGLVLGVGLIV